MNVWEEMETVLLPENIYGKTEYVVGMGWLHQNRKAQKAFPETIVRARPKSNKYPYHNINQTFNLTVSIIEWHKCVTALSTHKKNSMIKMTVHAVYKKAEWEGVGG